MRGLGRAATLVALPLVVAVACQRAAPGPAAPDVVARWNGGRLTAGEVEAALAERPPERRPQTEDGGAGGSWRPEFVAELVVDRLLADEAAAALSDPALSATLAETRRNLAWQEFLDHELDPIDPPSDDEVRQAFDSWSLRHERPERRLVRNIFLRRAAGESSPALKQRAQELARRARAGESFEALARRSSDSESRHRGGLLGFLTADDLPPPVSRVVFALAEHQVSEPLISLDGAHLFLVDSVRRAAPRDFAQDAPQVRRALESEAKEEALAAAAEALPDPPAPLSIVGPRELEELVARNDGAGVVLRCGDYQLTLASLLLGEGGGAPTLQRRLQHLAWREKVYALADSQGWFERPRLARELARETRERVGEFLRLRALQRELDAEPERLEEYYDEQRARFSTPLTLHLERWRRTAEGLDRKSIMLALESYYRKVGPEGVRWETVAGEHGGAVEDLGWVTLESVADEEEAALLAALTPGRTSPPHQSSSGIEMERALGRRDPTPRPFSEIEDEVRQAYLADRGAVLYRRWREALFARAGVELLEP